MKTINDRWNEFETGIPINFNASTRRLMKRVFFYGFNEALCAIGEVSALPPEEQAVKIRSFRRQIEGFVGSIEEGFV